MENSEYKSRNGLVFTHLDSLNFTTYNKQGELVFSYRYIPTQKYIDQVFCNYISPEELIEIYKYVARYSYHNQQPIYGSITDLTRMDGSFEPINEWLVKEYMPQAMASGFVFAAIVKPVDFFAGLALDDLLEIATYQAKDFEVKEDAVAWIEKNLRQHLADKGE